MAITHKIGNTEVTITLNTNGKAGLVGIEVDNKRIDNFRKLDKGYRPGSALKSLGYTPEFRKKYKMVEVPTAKGYTVPAFPLSMGEEKVAKALAEFHLSAGIEKREAKAEAKAKAEAAKAAKAEATKAEATK